MKTHVDKIKRITAKAATNLSEKENKLSGTFQFVDNRPKAIAQKKLQELASNGQSNKQTLQLKTIADNSLKKGSPLVSNAVIQKFSFQNRLEHHGWPLKSDYTFIKNGGTLYLPNMGDLLIARNVKHQPNMIAALQYAASRFSVIGNMANRIKAADGGMANAPNNRNANTMYPFVYEISVPFGGKSNTKTLTLKYQYANNATGYIIAQDLTGEGASDMTNAPNANAAPGLANTFFSTHGDTGSTKLSTLLEQDATLPQKENAERLDARTKLAGEGARFNVVKENMATMSDRTVIYTEDKTHAYYIRFRSLWMNWAGLFQSKYGITNEKLATELKNPSAWNPNYAPKKINKRNVKALNGIKI
jgi:hypothetical protein